VNFAPKPISKLNHIKREPKKDECPGGDQLPARARTPGKFSVWVKLNGNWTSAFSSNDRADAKSWAQEHIRFGSAVEKIELRDLFGAVEPIYDMTWPR
jgi:hypothetical protein